MLMGKEAPPELRLLLSQATFELPIFESIEDVDRALAQLDKLDEPGPAGMALLRAVAAPPPLPSPEDERGSAAADSTDPPHEAQIGAADAFAGAHSGAPGWLRVSRGRDLRGNCHHRPPARDASGDALSRRGPNSLNNAVAPIEIATSGAGAEAHDRTGAAPNASPAGLPRGQTPDGRLTQPASDQPTSASCRDGTGQASSSHPIGRHPTTSDAEALGQLAARSARDRWRRRPCDSGSHRFASRSAGRRRSSSKDKRQRHSWPSMPS